MKFIFLKPCFSWRTFVLCAMAACVVSVCAQNVTPAQGYAGIANQLSARIEQEMQEKQLPAMSIALIDDQSIVWAQGFGFEDAQKKMPATAHTVYRVGSVCKLFTDIAVMQMVERGRLDLDAPVAHYLAGFAPRNSFGGDITLRELMSHRSGLVREPPVGHYFDDSAPSLRATIESLNQTSLVFAPGTHTKYSNAGVATVGYALQQTAKQAYPAYLKSALLEPLGMNESAFAPEDALRKHLAAAYMWSHDGLLFPAPSFQLGEGPAGAMYSTVTDLGKFLSVLFANGHAASGQIIRPETLREMWTPQFAKAGDASSFGIGFRLSRLESEREIGHGGAIYGFATQLSALPDAKLGAVVITTMDGANAVTAHIAEDALRLMLAQRRHGAPETEEAAKEIPAGLSRKLAGDYAAGDERIHLDEENGALYLLPLDGGSLAKLRSVGDGELIEDSRVAYSPTRIHPHFDAAGEAVSITIGNKEYKRQPAEMLKGLRAQWGDFVGEYGWDYDKLYVLENEGRLRILVEWFDDEPLAQGSGKDAFQLPDHGLYVAETLKFLRDGKGAVTGVQIGGVTFPKRPEAAAGAVFQITPLKPVAELRKEALASTPPEEKGDFLKPDLVELTALDPTIRLDIRYATKRNFLGAPLYLQARAYMQRPAAEAVARASQRLHAMGYGLLIHDSYRPWYVTKMFWDGTPDDKKIFVANPAEGSRHNRGCAVDLTLYDLKTGLPIQMTGGYDEMSERSYPFYPGGSSIERWHRDLLRHVMEDEGFTVYEYEWWHFDYKDWRRYPILNLTFEQLDGQKQQAAAK
jgi:CubicO group peptidase (beta-lactamase class C family)/D-alanyl-D-alanine dipeptidase